MDAGPCSDATSGQFSGLVVTRAFAWQEQALKAQQQLQCLEAQLAEARHLRDATIDKSAASVAAAEQQARDVVMRADDRLMRETEQHRLANERAEEGAARASAQVAALEKQLQDATDACKVGCRFSGRQYTCPVRMRAAFKRHEVHATSRTSALLHTTTCAPRQDCCADQGSYDRQRQ